MRMFLIDTVAGTAKPVDIELGLDSYYEAIHCSSIDISCVTIEGRDFDVICDDEGLLVGDPVVSIVDHKGSPLICGSVLLTAYHEPDEDNESEHRDLSDAEIKLIQEHVVTACMPDRMYPVLMGDSQQ